MGEALPLRLGEATTIGLGGSCDSLAFFGVVGSVLDSGFEVTKGLVEDVGK
jgi:hypothetical protein